MENKQLKKKINWDTTFPFTDLRMDQRKMITDPLKFINKIPIILLLAPNGKGKTGTALSIGANKIEWNNIRKKHKNDELYSQIFKEETTNKVFFLSRTRRQNMNYLKTIEILNKKRKIKGEKEFKVVEWTSRRSLCINSYCLEESANIDFSCRNLTHHDNKKNIKYCKHPYDVDYRINILNTNPIDFNSMGNEDNLISYGNEKKVCPYYLSRSLGMSEDTDFVICAYNYIFDPFMRKALKINVSNSLIIVDECLTENTLVYMNNGTCKKITDVQNGDYVCGGKVSNKFEKTVNKIYKIKTSNGILETTENHPNFVIEKSNRDKYGKKKNSENSEVKVIKSKDLKIGNLMMVPHTLKHETIYEEYSPELLYFIGMMLCDGHIDKNDRSRRVKIDLHNLDKINRFEEIFNKSIPLIDTECQVKSSENHRILKNNDYFTKTIWVNSDKVKQYLYDFGVYKGKKSNDIDIDNKIFGSKLESIKYFIQACFDCEGWVIKKNPCLSFSSSSIMFVEKLKLLLLKFGIKSSIVVKSRTNKNHNTLYYLNITGENINIFNNNIGLSVESKKKLLKEISNDKKKLTYKQVVYNGILYNLLPIKNIEVVNKKTKVYDFTTESHQFIANGYLTHNCHNLEKITESALKREISEKVLYEILKEDINKYSNIDTLLSSSKNFFNEYYKIINEKCANFGIPKEKVEITYEEFGELLRKSNISSTLIDDSEEELMELVKDSKLFHLLPKLVNFVSFFRIYYTFTSNSFKTYQENRENFKGDVENFISVQSYDIEPIMHDLIRSGAKIILMTGTLNVDIFKFQFDLKENETIKTFSFDTDKRNMMTYVMDRGINGNILDSKYNNRRNDKMIIDLGNTLIKLLQKTPESGSLVFFTSEGLKKTFMDVWKKNGLIALNYNGSYFIDKDSNTKIQIYNDISEKNKSGSIISKYKKDAVNKKIVLFSCFRGKASEGEDYSKGEARSVFSVGLPLADITNRSVKYKMDYYNMKKKGYGWKWLISDAVNSVNQAIGRMIRKKTDYGIGFILENRFNSDYEVRDNLSDWIKDTIISSIYPDDYEKTYNQIIEFYDKNKK